MGYYLKSIERGVQEFIKCDKLKFMSWDSNLGACDVIVLAGGLSKLDEICNTIRIVTIFYF